MHSTNILRILRKNLHSSQYNKASYIQIMDSIATGGIVLPSEEIIKILQDILHSNHSWFINKLDIYLLQHNPNLSSEGESVLEIIHASLSMLESNLVLCNFKTPSTLAAKTVLEFVLKVFVNELEASEPGHTCLLEAVLLLTSKQAWLNKLFTNIFLLSSLELHAPGNGSLLKCLDVVLNLAMIPLAICKSKMEQDDLSFTIAKEISLNLEKISSTSKKCFFLWRIPSDEIRCQVIDIHLDTYFRINPQPTPVEEPFSLSKFKNIHLCRSPVKLNGRHEGSYLLSLLALLLQSHVFIINGAPLLPFLPHRGPSNEDDNLRMSDLHESVLTCINRLSSDGVSSADLISNWHYLEILLTLTS